MSKAASLAGFNPASTLSALTTAQGNITSLSARPGMWVNNVDNFTNVSIGQPNQSFVRSMYHVDVGAVQTGDLFLLFMQGQLRSEWDFNVECGAWMSWTTVANGVLNHDGETNHNLIIPGPTGRNLRMTHEHYFDFQPMGHCTVYRTRGRTSLSR